MVIAGRSYCRSGLSADKMGAEQHYSHHTRLRALAAHISLGLGGAPASGDGGNPARRRHAPGMPPSPRATTEWQDRIAALHELVPMAKQQMKREDWEFMRGGSDTETSVRRNRLSIDSLALCPSMATDVSSVDTSTTLFGRNLSLPLITAPMGGMWRWCPEGAVAAARATEISGMMTCLSSLADGQQPRRDCSLEGVAHDGSPNGAKIFQLYVRGDQAFVDDYATRAVAAGYDAFAITLDVMLISRREGLLTSRAQKDPGIGGSLSGGSDGLAEQAAFSWSEIAGFRQRWPDLPLILKGIMTVKDAVQAVDLGCAGIWVSNHGGRQLDSAHGGYTVLPRIAKAVAQRAVIIVDGGVCRGADLVKAVPTAYHHFAHHPPAPPLLPPLGMPTQRI